MNRHGWKFGVVLLMTVSATGVHAQEKTVPEIWMRIEQEAESIAKESVDGEWDRNALQMQLDEEAREIADHCGRSDIETMVRTVNAHLPRPHAGQMYVNAISIRVLVEVADPKGEHGLKDLRRRGGSWESNVSWYGVAVAAIDVYHDNRSRDLLVELALKEGLFGWTLEEGGGSSAFASPVVYALGLLRSYEPQEIRPKIEAALRVETGKEKPKVPPNATCTTSADYLRALLESWKYAASLDPAERDRYRDFEHRLWRAWALARGWGSRKGGVPFWSAAGTLEKHWKQGDDRFLLRIFEEPTSTVKETRIAEHLAHRFSADTKKRLEAIADGSSPKAGAARRALEEAARRHH